MSRRYDLWGGITATLDGGEVVLCHLDGVEIRHPAATREELLEALEDAASNAEPLRDWLRRERTEARNTRQWRRYDVLNEALQKMGC